MRDEGNILIIYNFSFLRLASFRRVRSFGELLERCLAVLELFIDISVCCDPDILVFENKMTFS